MFGRIHQLNECEFEQTPGVNSGQGSLACCSPGGSQRVRHNWATELNWEFTAETIWFWALLCCEIHDLVCSDSLISLWFSVGGLSDSRNLSIFSRYIQFSCI